MNAGLFTTNDSIFIIPHKEYTGPMDLIDLPEDTLPFNLAPRTTHSNLHSFVMRPSTTDGFKYIFAHTFESRLRIRNQGILTAPLNPNEVTLENFEKLLPTWMLPGLTHLDLPLTTGVEKPFQGLWIGDYSNHGGEILLFLQRIPSQLEAIKVTGDLNVPRGEYSFVIPNMDDPSHISHEIEFRGVRAVRGWGQIAGMHFSYHQWVEVEGLSCPRSFFLMPVFLQSHDEISVYWEVLNNISSFKRINLGELLDPDYNGTHIRD